MTVRSDANAFSTSSRVIFLDVVTSTVIVMI